MRRLNPLVLAPAFVVLLTSCFNSHLSDEPSEPPASIAEAVNGAGDGDGMKPVGQRDGGTTPWPIDPAAMDASQIGQSGSDGSVLPPGATNAPPGNGKPPPEAKEDEYRPGQSVVPGAEPLPSGLAADFLAAWRVKVAQDDAEQGDGAESTACTDCVATSSCQQPTDCSAGLACVYRHCLCTEDSVTTSTDCRERDFTEDLVACVDPCFADDDVECRTDLWEFMGCVTSTCSTACQQ